MRFFRRPGSRSESLDQKLVSKTHEGFLPSARQLKFFRFILSPFEKQVLQACAVLLGVSLVLFGLRAYYRTTEVVAVVGGNYSEALIGAPQHINPIYALANDVDMDLSRLLFNGLFRLDQNQQLVNDLIIDYGMSDDQKTYTFYLRQDVKWHDGESMTSDDVVFTMRAIQDAEYQSPLRPSLFGAEIQKLTNYSFNITLAEPFAPFLTALTFGILPEHLWFDISPSTANLAERNLKPIGTGPYQFDQLTKDRLGNILSYRLKRTNDYYGEQASIRELTIRFYPDINSAIEALKSKSVDGISFLPQDAKDQLKRVKHLEYHSLRLPQYTAIFFNQKNALLKQQEIRQALFWSVDRSRIVQDVLGGEGEVINTPILPGFLGHNPEADVHAYDVEAAKKLLDDNGWALLEGETVRKKDGKELAFALTTVEQPEYVQTVELLRQAWESIGIRVETRIISNEEIQSTVIKPRDYEALLFGEIIGSDPDPYPFWHSSQSKDPGLNLAVFYDKDVDQLLEEARQTSDAEQRRIKYLHFQNILAEQLPAIFLFSPRYTYAVNRKVKGIGEIYISSPSDRFLSISEWYIKTKRK